ncbi:hypothetical protein [Spirochaeta thermophila]|uniref:Uncharacterized protein n=1 Tax=Winmispira thermophila (strain ATCC 49972 / DSM 6192 / RI 19.B1) TaxID=665571 RepID=E0RP58_WINT6|nr:hypothetical protein [Spirochaeta thermophila]ADN02720.1 hypothetical protein STHERM_c17850 [Spirochaeta thermophila DSM 6192]
MKRFGPVVRHLLAGYLSLFDLSGRTMLSVVRASGGAQRDRASLSRDWARVGGDLKTAMEQVGNER